MNLKLIRSRINKRFEKSNLTVFPNIVKNKSNSIKFLWSISYILTAACSWWFIMRSITDYFNHNVVTKTLVKHEHGGLIFPIIGICNINPFTTEYSKEFISNIIADDEQNIDNLYQSIIYANYISNETMSKFNRKLFGQNLKEFLIDCKFANSKCDMELDFEYYYDVNYGNCYRYNSGRNMKGEKVDQKYVYSHGINNALDLELFIGSAYENTFSFSYENGFVLFINNESLDSTYYEGVTISPGTSTKIIISSQTNRKQPKPYSECTSNLISLDSYSSDPFKKALLANNFKYHYMDCFVMCYQKYLGDFCHCQTSYYNLIYYKEMRRCSIDVDIETQNKDTHCDDNLWINLTNNSDMVNKCDCPVECEYSGYTYKVSVSEYPSKIYGDYLTSNNNLIKAKFYNATQLNLRESIARVRIFYDEMIKVTVSEEIKTQLADLVSSCGGIIGLFMGLSFLSMFEFIEIIIKILVVLFKLNSTNINTVE